MMDEGARREVLTRFVEACDPVPTEAQLGEWRLRHPGLAADFDEFAEVMAKSPGADWKDDGRASHAVARSLELVETLEGAFDFLLSRSRGGIRVRDGRRGGALTRA